MTPQCTVGFPSRRVVLVWWRRGAKTHPTCRETVGPPWDLGGTSVGPLWGLRKTSKNLWSMTPQSFIPIYVFRLIMIRNNMCTFKSSNCSTVYTPPILWDIFWTTFSSLFVNDISKLKIFVSYAVLSSSKAKYKYNVIQLLIQHQNI